MADIAYENIPSHSMRVLAASQTRALILADAVPLERHPAAVYLARLAPGSRRTMRGSLEAIAELLIGQADARALDWSALRFQHTAAIRARLAATYAPTTTNKMLSALRGVLKAAWRLGLMDAEQYHRAADLEAVRGERLPAGRSLTGGEIAAIFAACARDPSAAGARDAATLAMLRLGLRRAEVAGLAVGDVDLASLSVRVTGKGRKQRLVPLTEGAAAALGDWLALRGDDPGPLLLAVNKGGRVLAHGLTPQAIYDLLRRRTAEANVTSCTPHDWRRSFASDLLDAGADLLAVQRLMGHANPSTTSRYDRRGEAAQRKAVDLLHVPYTGRGTA